MARNIKNLKPSGKFTSGDFAKYNPKKYFGEYPIIYRSSYELKFMLQLEYNPLVEKWSSENIVIPYLFPVMVGNKIVNKRKNYHMDFQVFMVKGHKYLCEVKPMAFVPLNESQIKNNPEIRKNAYKWKAALRWCEANDHKFKIITEKHLKFPIR